MHILVSGGPGSGCTATAKALSAELGIAMFDSDDFFHKPSDPPFQYQYSPEERRSLLGSALSKENHWILSGSVSTWGLEELNFTVGIFLEVSGSVRLKRLQNRQLEQFGDRIDLGGDMYEEHESFIKWAEEYEDSQGIGRNLSTDKKYLIDRSKSFLVIREELGLKIIVQKVLDLLRKNN